MKRLTRFAKSDFVQEHSLKMSPNDFSIRPYKNIFNSNVENHRVAEYGSLVWMNNLKKSKFPIKYLICERAALVHGCY